MLRLLPRRAVPWLLVLEAAMVAREHWGLLEPGDRNELGRIVRKSRGRPGNLTDHERRELKRIVGKLDLLAAGRRMVPIVGKRRGRRR